MSHSQATNWIKGLVGDTDVKGRFAGKAVLELGSFNVNGEIRSLLGPVARYVGVDHRGGPGVDHVSLFHDIPWTEEFDVLVCCNTFEHDPYWKKSLAAGIRALKPGGEILIMAAGPGYPAHEIQCAPIVNPNGEYYANIEPQELLNELVLCGALGNMTVFIEPPDIAFHGQRAPQPA